MVSMFRAILRQAVWVSMFLAVPVAQISAAEVDIPCSVSKFAHLPVLSEGCEREGCADIFPNFVIADMPLHKKPDLESDIVDTLKKCEPLGDFKTFEVLERSGVAKVVYPGACAQCKNFKRGDKIRVVSVPSEGFFTACVKGDLISAARKGAKEPAPSKEDTIANIIQEPISRAWMQVKTPRGKVGFAPLADSNRAITRTPTQALLETCNFGKGVQNNDSKPIKTGK